MIEYADALRAIIARAKPLPSETVPLLGSLGRTLARDIKAAAPVPPFAKATMDGYAVRAEDTAPAGGKGFVELDVIEDLPAGRVGRRKVGPGEAVRIMTGAPLPAGADAVVMVEDTERSDGRVRIRRGVSAGDNIGQAGEDIMKGALVLERGSVVGPAEAGMLASLGRASIRVARRPRLAVIATGDEIVEPGEPAGPGRIRNANGYSLTAMAVQAGAEAAYLGIARDKSSSLRAKIKRAEGGDILVLSGGVSVGDYDLVKDQLRTLGVRPVFWQVNIKPGKPVFFGVRGRQLVFGLPGNPTSAMVTFHLFARTAIARMLGRKAVEPQRAAAVLESDVRLKPGRTQFLRGVLAAEGPVLRVEPYADQKSGVLRSMVASRCLIHVPAGTARLEKGARVEILPLDRAWPS
jgi:molybdopterin molybdotransferase